MKTLRIVAVIVIVLAAVAITINAYRDTIGRRVANQALSGQNLKVSNLSIESIDTDRVRFAELVLEQPSGARVRIVGMSLPLEFRGRQSGTLTIDALAFEPADVKGDPTSLAVLLQLVLDPPSEIPYREIRVGEITAPFFPPASEVIWRATGDGQTLKFDIDQYTANIDLARQTSLQHQANVSLNNRDGSEASAVRLDIAANDNGFAIDGTIRLDVISWLPVYHRIGIVPIEVTALNAALAGNVTLRIPRDASEPVPIAAELTPMEGVSMVYSLSDGTTVDVQVVSTEVIQANLEYPALTWTATVAGSELLVDTDIVENVPIELSSVRCLAGIRCELAMSINAGPLHFGERSVESLKFSSPAVITTGEQLNVEFSTEATLSMSNLRQGDLQVSEVIAGEHSGMQISVDEQGWRSRTDSLQLALGGIAFGSLGTANLPLRLSSLSVTKGGDNIDSRFTSVRGPRSLKVADFAAVVPDFAGEFHIQGAELSADATVTSPDGALQVPLTLRHDTSTGRGNMTANGARYRFDSAPLSSLLLKWPYAWDLIAGATTSDVAVSWSETEDGFNFDGTVTQTLENVAGKYEDIGFGNLSSKLDIQLDPAGRWTMNPATIRLALLDIGIPLTEISAKVDIDVANKAAAIGGFSLGLLGGTLKADSFVFSMGKENNIMLEPKGIQLGFIVELLDFEKVSMTGSVSGSLPLTIGEDSVIIEGGRIESDGSGVIRYASGQGVGAEDSQVGLVSQALGNFAYDSLSSDVNYDQNGDLKLKMRLTGVSPDMDPNQPVILNLGVENNIPQMMRSLQATRSIEDILEQRAAK